MCYSCCDECIFVKVIRGAQRGAMDCDPDETICELGQDYFDGWREYDEETGEELECERYQHY